MVRHSIDFPPKKKSTKSAEQGGVTMGRLRSSGEHVFSEEFERVRRENELQVRGNAGNRTFDSHETALVARERLMKKMHALMVFNERETRLAELRKDKANFHSYELKLSERNRAISKREDILRSQPKNDGEKKVQKDDLQDLDNQLNALNTELRGYLGESYALDPVEEIRAAYSTETYGSLWGRNKDKHKADDFLNPSHARERQAEIQRLANALDYLEIFSNRDDEEKASSHSGWTKWARERDARTRKDDISHVYNDEEDQMLGYERKYTTEVPKILPFTKEKKEIPLKVQYRDGRRRQLELESPAHAAVRARLNRLGPRSPAARAARGEKREEISNAEYGSGSGLVDIDEMMKQEREIDAVNLFKESIGGLTGEKAPTDPGVFRKAFEDFAAAMEKLAKSDKNKERFRKALYNEMIPWVANTLADTMLPEARQETKNAVDEIVRDALTRTYKENYGSGGRKHSVGGIFMTFVRRNLPLIAKNMVTYTSKEKIVPFLQLQKAILYGENPLGFFRAPRAWKKLREDEPAHFVKFAEYARQLAENAAA